ncbi:MAG: DNA gyrase subunit B [Candidatus Micrarchaeaceae archaeon]
MSGEEYTASDILVLSGPQGVRKRPAMYVGSTGSSGFIHLLFEVLDNSIDEAVAGFCKNIVVRLENENGVDVAEVSDDGRGIPVDIIPKLNKPALEVIMTSLHSGAKFENKAYKVSGGLHGVGLTVVNALSEYVEVTVKRNGKVYRQRFGRGNVLSPLEIVGELQSNETGTKIRFKPDSEIFSVNSFDTILLTERIRDLSFLNPKIKITLIDTRGGVEETSVFYSQNYMRDFLEYLRKGRNEVTKQIVFNKNTDSVNIAVAIQYIEGYSEELLSFVNNIRTYEGGSHVSGFHAALTRAISNYINKNVKKNGKNVSIEGDDTHEGLIGIISVLLQNPEFEGQTKEKLGNTNIKSVVENSVYLFLTEYLEENPSEAAKIVDKVTKAAEAREAAKRARELTRKRNLLEGSVLPGKLADCTETDPEKSELFIVEGESAAGSSKQGRDRNYQAILPLRGKILNVEKAADEKIFGNAELRAIVTALGANMNGTVNADEIRYKKIIFLTDADVDGSHIKTLLLTFFFRYLRPLIDKGYVYIANPPLYRVSFGKSVKYAYNDQELNDLLKESGGKGAVQRYKGLGEMNPEQLWETTLDPNSRILKKITVKDAELADSIFSILMGMDSKERRRFLEEHSSEVSFLDV